MSEIKVNKISPRSGTTVTLGDSGDTFTIPAGATINNQGTATNFGATGSASWVTTVKTGDFTAVAGEGYFVNTTSGEVDVTLPAGTAGAVVAIKDYAGTFDTNKVTLIQNGSDKIGGSTVNATLNAEGIAVTLVFIDSTQGWLVTDSGLQDEAPTSQYVTATGGTITTCGDFKIHTFTGPGALCVSCAGNASGNNQLEYIVVAGGGGNGYPGGNNVGGAGAGGFRFASPSLAPATYPGKPLAAPAGLTATVQSYPVTVGAGGSSEQVLVLKALRVQPQHFQQYHRQVEQKAQYHLLVLALVMRVVQVLVEQVEASVELEVQEILHQLVHHKVIMVEIVYLPHLWVQTTHQVEAVELYVRALMEDHHQILMNQDQVVMEQVYQQHSVQMVNLVVHLDITQVVVLEDTLDQ